MSRSNKPGFDGKKVTPTDLCGVCGTSLDGTRWHALVPDSSAVQGVDSVYDGKRMVAGCSREHLAELLDHYERRPFVDAEQWAGKIIS